MTIDCCKQRHGLVVAYRHTGYSTLNNFGTSQSVTQAAPLLANNEDRVNDTKHQSAVAQTGLPVGAGQLGCDMHNRSVGVALAQALATERAIKKL